jgi:hypothetical protein
VGKRAAVAASEARHLSAARQLVGRDARHKFRYGFRRVRRTMSTSSMAMMMIRAVRSMPAPFDDLGHLAAFG